MTLPPVFLPGCSTGGGVGPAGPNKLSPGPKSIALKFSDGFICSGCFPLPEPSIPPGISPTSMGIDIVLISVVLDWDHPSSVCGWV